MRKRFNFSISILLVLSLVFCNITVALADETIQTGTGLIDMEIQDSNALPDTEASREPEATPDDEEDREPEALPDKEEVQEPEALPDKEEIQEPEALPDKEEIQEPEALPDKEEAREPGTVPDADETKEPVQAEKPQQILEESEKASVRLICFVINDPLGMMDERKAGVETGKSYTVPSGYDFSQGTSKLIGWKTTDVNGVEETYKSGESFIMPSRDVVLTGIWEDFGKEDENKTYTVYYDYNAPVAFGFPTEKKYAQAGSTVVVAFQPAISGYEFIGWETTDVDGGKILFQDGGSFIMPGNDVTLVGVWKDLSEKDFTVTYILNPEYRDTYNLSNPGGKTLGDGMSYSEQKNIKDRITAFGVVVTEKGRKTADKHVEMSMESDVTGQKGGQYISYSAGTIISIWDGQNAKVSYSGETPFGFTNFAEGTEVRIMVTPGAKIPELQSYTVKFLNQNGEELTNLTKTAEEGSSLDMPPSLENYYTTEENSKIQVFYKWIPQSEGYTLADLNSVTQDMTFKASFKDVTAKWFIRYNSQNQEEDGSSWACVKELVVKDIKPINANGSMEPSAMEEIQNQIISNAYNPWEVPVLTQDMIDGLAEVNEELKDSKYEDYKIVWYVFKESNDGYHVNGLLVKKQEDNKGEDSVTPGNPENPPTPGNPGNTGKPSTPENPGNPPTPDNPANPENPGNPPTPDNPGNTGKPSTPGNPGSSEIPSSPSNPSIPEEETDIGDDEIPQAPGNTGEIDIEKDEIPKTPADAEEIDLEDEEIPGGPAADSEKDGVSDGETEIPEDEIPQAPAASLPQTGTASEFFFYGIGLLMMTWGVSFFRRRKA